MQAEKITPAELAGVFYFAGNYFPALKIIFRVMKLNVDYELGEYKFEWDSEKEKINRKKHGLTFETAARVFLDENAYSDYDEIHSDFEDRIKIVGRVGKILTVIYTERGDKNRIISARQATHREADLYYGQFDY